MKSNNEKNVNKEISNLLGNIFSNKPITKKDIEKIKELKKKGNKK